MESTYIIPLLENPFLKIALLFSLFINQSFKNPSFYIYWVVRACIQVYNDIKIKSNIPAHSIDNSCFAKKKKKAEW